MDANDIKQLQKVIHSEIGDALEQIVLPEIVTLKTLETMRPFAPLPT